MGEALEDPPPRGAGFSGLGDGAKGATHRSRDAPHGPGSSTPFPPRPDWKRGLRRGAAPGGARGGAEGTAALSSGGGGAAG